MYSTLSAEAPASDEIWLAFTALRLLDDAVAALAEAEVTAAGLAADSAWRSRGHGARSMSAAFTGLHESVRAQLAAVRSARSVVGAGLGA